MSAKIIDGVAIAKRLRMHCTERVVRLQRETGVTAALAVVMVGDHTTDKKFFRS